MIKAIAMATLVIGLVLPGCSAAETENYETTDLKSPNGSSGSSGSSEGKPATEAWQQVLERFHADGGLDYAGLAADRANLDIFLNSLSGVDADSLAKNDRMAFWINAYNAVTAHHVLERYPGIQSVQDVKGFFDKLTYPVAGQSRTLDAIETAGRDLGDARIHFAVVCASTSCPDLRGEAFRGATVEAQLKDQTLQFLANPSKGMRYDEAKNDVYLSSIFKWYAGDFTGGSTVVAFFARGGVLDWVAANSPSAVKAKLEKNKPSVAYLDYDWGLNDRPGTAR